MTHSDKAPTAEQLARARRIAAHALCGPEKWKPGVKAGIYEEIMRGDADAEALVQGPLAAIIETTAREAALIEAVRGALECLGKPDGYLPDIGAPKTRALQRAFEAYEPHPTFKGY